MVLIKSEWDAINDEIEIRNHATCHAAETT